MRAPPYSAISVIFFALIAPALGSEITSNYVGPRFGLWSQAANWSPVGVPDNGGGNTYDVILGGPASPLIPKVDVVATVNSLAAYSQLYSLDGSLTVLQSTDLHGFGIQLKATDSDMVWSLGNLADFQNGSLTGKYELTAGPGKNLLFRFNGADITTNQAQLYLSGLGLQFVDENGLSAIRNLASNERTISLRNGISLITQGPLVNTGYLEVGIGGGSLTVNGNLANPGSLSLRTHTTDPSGGETKVRVIGNLTTGPDSTISIGGGELTNPAAPASLVVEGSYDGVSGTTFVGDLGVGGTFQFVGAHITENAGDLWIGGVGGRIIDENQSDALTGFIRNRKGADFSVANGKVQTLPGGFDNQGAMEVYAGTYDSNDTRVVVGGAMTNSGSLKILGIGRKAEVEVAGNLMNSGGLSVQSHGAMRGYARIKGVLTNLDTLQIATGYNGSEAMVEADSLANLAGTVLESGTYIISCPQAGVATLRVSGANVVTNKAALYLSGAAMAFDNGAGQSALRNLAMNAPGGEIALDNGTDLVTASTFTNNGQIWINSKQSSVIASASLTVPGSLTNFNNGNLTGGKYSLRSTGSTKAATLRLNGADIVTNGAVIDLFGPYSQILDENGLNGLRNLAAISSEGGLNIDQSFTTTGDFRNDGALGIYSFGIFGNDTTFVINGSLTNFTNGKLTGGAYFIRGDRQTATLRFNGANIVTNAAEISLIGASKTLDENGLDGLRNLAANEGYLRACPMGRKHLPINRLVW